MVILQKNTPRKSTVVKDEPPVKKKADVIVNPEPIKRRCAKCNKKLGLTGSTP